MWINPYEEGMKNRYSQVRANFHTHARNINIGPNHFIEDTCELYEKLNYDLLTISNHNRITPMQFRNTPEKKMKFLDGYEHSAEKHLLCLNVEHEYHTHIDYQAIIDDVNTNGGITILCHPNYKHDDYWSEKEMQELTSYCGIEVVNSLGFRFPGSGVAIREWDILLTAGKKVWGFGGDDHHMHSDAGRAWNMILAPSNDPMECMMSVKRGAHYISTGMRLTNIHIEKEVLYCEAVRMHETHMKDYLYRFISREGRILKEEYSDKACCRLSEEEGYVRVQVINEEGGMLLTQPIFTQNWFNS